MENLKSNLKEKYVKFKEINLYLFGLSFFSNFDVAKIFLGIMIVCLIIDTLYFKEKLDCGNNKLRNFIIFLVVGGTIWNFCADFNYKAARAYLKINRYSVIVFYMYSLIKTNKVILRNFIISLLLSYITLVIRGLNFYFIENRRDRFGSFEGIMDVAVLVSVVGAFCFGNIIKIKDYKYKILNSLVLIFTLFLLVITQTRAALLAIIGGVIVSLIFNKNIKIIIISCVLGGVLLFGFLQSPYSSRFKSNTFNTKITLNNMSNGLRVEMWKNALWRFKQHPIMGSGTKQDAKLYAEYVNNMPETTEIQKIYKQAFKEGYDDSHNMYLNSLTDNGIFLLVQLILIFGILPYILFKNNEFIYSVGIIGGLASYYIFGVAWPIWRHGWDPMLLWGMIALTCCSIEAKEKIKNFYYIDTLYSLFICLLIENNLNENFYFLPSRFPITVRSNLKNRLIIRETRTIKLFEYITNGIFFRIIKFMFFKKVENKNFYIHDAGKYAQYFLNNFDSKFIDIEDGTMNYNLYKINNELEKSKKNVRFSKKIKRRFCYGIKKIYPPLGVSEKIEKIILTGILPIPDIIKHKVEIINIEDKWKSLSEEKKKLILSIFNVKLEELKILEKMKNKVLLLTQPLSEDGIISEEEKISMYREILKERNIQEIYIKEHPREKTNYSEEFKDIKVNIIKKEFPVEILLLLNIKFDKVITIFSTAALNFREKSEIEFIGTKKYPKLLEKFGVLEDNKEQGTRNKEQGTRNKEQGTR